MKIESIIKRDPPTEVVLGDTTYKFAPDSQGRHVAEVTDKHHIARLLSIAEGYQLADDETLPKSVKTELDKELEVRTQGQQATFQPVDEHVLKGSTVHPATFDIKGEQISIEDVIAVAHEESAMTTAEWNALPDEDRHNLIDAVLDAMAGEEGPVDPNQTGTAQSTQQGDKEEAPKDNAAKDDGAKDEAAAKAERDELAAQWKARTGSLPHYKWTADKIRAELAKPADEGK
jgi:hypothetical protein